MLTVKKVQCSPMRRTLEQRIDVSYGGLKAKSQKFIELSQVIVNEFAKRVCNIVANFSMIDLVFKNYS